MERNLFALSLGLAGLLLIPALGRATPVQCAAHDKMVAQLATDYGEEARSIGLGADNTVMELYTSVQTGTWSMTVTLVNGVTCVVATGANFETVAPIPAAPPQEAKGDPT